MSTTWDRATAYLYQFTYRTNHQGIPGSVENTRQGTGTSYSTLNSVSDLLFRTRLSSAPDAVSHQPSLACTQQPRNHDPMDIGFLPDAPIPTANTDPVCYKNTTRQQSRLPSPRLNADQRANILKIPLPQIPTSLDFHALFTRTAMSVPPRSTDHAVSAEPSQRHNVQQAPEAKVVETLLPPIQKEEKQGMCLICCESFASGLLLHPCDCCGESYCQDCVKEMFISATEVASRMPPRCCHMLQLHAGLPNLPIETADLFRKKFEEWMAPQKLYCPVPTCSSFVPISQSRASTTNPITNILKGLPSILRNMAHFVEASLATTKRSPPNDIQILLAKLPSYTSTIDVVIDFNKAIESTSGRYTGTVSVATDRKELRGFLLRQLSTFISEHKNSFDDNSASPDTVACPDCHISICTTCKGVGHPGRPCDASAHDYEEALLLSFKYKRCPRCRTAVKRMYGCDHMMCHCGATWCWRCGELKIDCGSHEDDDDNEDDYYSDEDDADPDEDDSGSVDEEGGSAEENSDSDEGFDEQEHVAAILNLSSAIDARGHTHEANDREIRANDEEPHRPLEHVSTPGSSTEPVVEQAPTDLDAGGARRWERERYDFGDEPPNQSLDPNSCAHNFKLVRPGKFAMVTNTTIVECNGCFGKCQVREYSENKTREAFQLRSVFRDSHGAEKIFQKLYKCETAWGCTGCNVFYCGECKDRK